MSAATVVVKTFVNENGQVVAMDSYGNWKVYNPRTKSFGPFAKAPQTPASEATPAGVTPEEPAASATSHPPPPPNNDELVRLREELSQMKEVLAQAQAALLDSKEKRQAALDELALVRAAKMQSDADKTNLDRELVQAKEDKAIAERNFSARSKELGEANDKVSKAEAAVKAAQEVQKKAEGELATANSKLAAKPSLYGYVRTSFAKNQRLLWGAVAMLAVVVLLAAYGLKQLFSSSPPPYYSSTQLTEPMPTDYDSIKTELAEIKAKQKLREKSEAALIESLQNRPPLVPLESP